METLKNQEIKADALIIGAGIAGLQAALDLADQGKKVVLIEKSPSIGGKMINLSKVFPTLDCASCITTPRMASVAHHSQIKTLTYTEVEHIVRDKDRFKATLRKKPRYVIEEKCIGCRQCETACPILMPDSFEHGMGARKAIYIPFTNAIPQYALLDMEHCIMCGACAKACPADCIDYLQSPQTIQVDAGAVLITTGNELTPKDAKQEYGAGKFPNVITALQAERLLAPHGPYGGVMRPSDGKIPSSIAFVQCAGSRDHSLNIPYCSRVCCMFAIKQATLMSGALPIADVTIYYMDIRAFGKGYEQFYQNAKNMGIQFVKAKVAKIREEPDHDLVLRIERQESLSAPEEVKHDLVVLSLGMVPGCHWAKQDMSVPVSDDGFIHSSKPKTSPTLTDVPGVFAAGTSLGPKDIVDTIVEASAAAMEISTYLQQHS